MRHHAIGPLRDLLDRFPVWATVLKHNPTRLLRPNFRAGEAFVGAVIPLLKVRLDSRDGPQPGERAGALGSLSWTREYVVEGDIAQTLPELHGLTFAVFREREISASRVPAGERPLGFAVAKKEDLGRHVL